jgi:mannose-6-phosphate isomerase
VPVRKLEPSFHERIWGATKLDPWFPNSRSKAGPFPIGEVWFETPEIPLLVKFLFASEKLSVQVHPDDVYARFHHSSPGKTEMWHVLAAQPGAQIAAGFRKTVTSEQARAAALSGEIVDLMEWFDAKPGDTFFIPAGTVHAIGAGLTICEIQQRSDITYRFCDYGRGRELHLDRALAVGHLGPHAARSSPTVSCVHFVTEPVDVSGAVQLPPPARPQLLIAIDGEGQINGETVRAGDVWHVTVSSEPIEIAGNLRILRTFTPGSDPPKPFLL